MPKFYPDFRFIEIEYELWALEHLLGVLEQQIAYLRDQDPVRTFAELRERGWEHDEGERQLAAQELTERKAIHDLRKRRSFGPNLRSPAVIAIPGE